MTASIRLYQPQDLGEVLQLWQRTGALPVGSDGLTVDQAVDLLGADTTVALVAEDDRGLLGMTLASAAGVVGWIFRTTSTEEGSNRLDVIGSLLDEAAARLSQKGVRKVYAVIGDDADVRAALTRDGYSTGTNTVIYDRELSGGVVEPSRLRELGARRIDPGLWQQLKGIDEAKEIIERRVILPLANPEQAARHAVASPRAVVLFGPPGTGKTTFAKGIASRLEWPFVEIHPPELAGEGQERQAKLLAAAFDLILELPSAVVFVDEVEDIASVRTEDRKVTPSIANEFLKQIPRLRDVPHHLLVCATNWVGRLDSAFLRPGRFDYVLPVGPPDAEARHAVWQRYADEIADGPLDLERIVDSSDLFTPADIEFAARKAAQRAFEREVLGGTAQRATTDDFLWAIERTRPTLSKEIVENFEQETRDFGRY
jgi:AAA+ superfamily predicted ATPase